MTVIKKIIHGAEGHTTPFGCRVETTTAEAPCVVSRKRHRWLTEKDGMEYGIKYRREYRLY